MPLITKNIEDAYFKFGIWEITEPESYFLKNITLSGEEKLLLDNAKSNRRRIEILSVRLLARSLGLKTAIKYTTSGKPKINTGNISISHSRQYSALIFHKEREVAIDIEKISIIPLKGRHLVFNTKEIEFAKNDQELFTTLWCCKECIVKIRDNLKINYLSQIHIYPFNKTSLIECDYFEGGLRYRYTFKHRRLNEHIIVWTC